MKITSKPTERIFTPFDIVISVQTEMEAVFLKQFFGNLTNKNMVDTANANPKSHKNHQTFDANQDCDMLNEITNIYSVINLLNFKNQCQH